MSSPRSSARLYSSVGIGFDFGTKAIQFNKQKYDDMKIHRDILVMPEP